MARKPAGIKLATRDGHVHWTDPVLCPIVGGYALAVECDFGGRQMTHYFGPDPQAPGQLVELAQPYVWPSARDALAALDSHHASVVTES